MLACPEALSAPAARARVVAAAETDTVYSRVFDVAQGIPWPAEFGGRTLANELTDRWAGREAALAADDEGRRRILDAHGDPERGPAYVYAGQGVGSVRRERPAGEVVREMVSTAEVLLRRWGPTSGTPSTV